MIRFSVIVPIYGVEKYIEQCIDSILNQTYSNFELILVDDGSKDRCPQICDAYREKDDRIIVIHKKNGGLVSARKAGAQIATGDYVCCVDGDDYIDEKYLEGFAEIINNYSVDMVCCGYHLTMINSKKECKVNSSSGYYLKRDIERDIFPKIIQNSRGEFFLPTVWGKAIKRDIYVKNQMLVSDLISMGEDGACMIPIIIQIDTMYIMDVCLYYYRYNNTSITKNKKPLKWEGQIAIAKHLADNINLSSYDFLEQYYRRVEKGFFTVAKSQFNSDNGMKNICENISKYYLHPVFKESIINAKYSGVKMKIIDAVVKNKMFILMMILNKIH
ncbi:glycosyltransferase family 2 protein [Clostridium perfringens]|uniref:glycosyltransferase family 2 protein n=1 Tax=Clostridium perfringens TaxID=1502 RepID=UPI001FB11A0E|nr:glycosyltransferase family 2 protein [Clostridium perfringens]MDK0843667.1 glycosyltransferase family 2 protein [Clostridium perfringens]